jgi:hypothetical protein
MVGIYLLSTTLPASTLTGFGTEGAGAPPPLAKPVTLKAPQNFFACVKFRAGVSFFRQAVSSEAACLRGTASEKGLAR